MVIDSSEVIGVVSLLLLGYGRSCRVANYIDKNILCQAYIHIKSEHLTDEELLKLEQYLDEFVTSRADFFLYPDPDIDIAIKDGSIKLYVTILGTLSALFTGVANYPDFREGAIQIYDDAKRLSDYMTTESLFQAKARHNDVIRVEARTGIIGSVKKVINDLDAVKSQNGSVMADTLATKLSKSKEDIGKLLSNLNTEEDRKLVKDGLTEIINKFPSAPTAPPKKRNHSDLVEMYQRELDDIKRVIQESQV